MVSWNYYTTTIAINNFANYTLTKEGRDISTNDICDRINAYIPCNNKEIIIKNFIEDANKANSMEEYKESTNKLLTIIYDNWIVK